MQHATHATSSITSGYPPDYADFACQPHFRSRAPSRLILIFVSVIVSHKGRKEQKVIFVFQAVSQKGRKERNKEKKARLEGRAQGLTSGLASLDPLVPQLCDSAHVEGEHMVIAVGDGLSEDVPLRFIGGAVGFDVGLTELLNIVHGKSSLEKSGKSPGFRRGIWVTRLLPPFQVPHGFQARSRWLG